MSTHFRSLAVLGCTWMASLLMGLTGVAWGEQNDVSILQASYIQSDSGNFHMTGHGKSSCCSASCSDTCNSCCSSSCCSNSCCSDSGCNSCDSCCDSCGGDCCCEEYCPHFVFTGGYLLMTREYYRNSPIVTDGVTGATLLSMGDLEGTYNPGFEVGGRLGRLSLRYFQLSNDVETYIASPNAIFTGGPAGVAQYNYDTDLYNGEINLIVCDPCSCIRIDTGFRYLRLNEQFNFHFAPPVPPPLAFTQTRNDLYGWQIGVDACVPKQWESPISVSAFTKAGIFGAETRMQYLEGGFDFRDSSRRVAFVGELGVKAHANISFISLDAGYQVLFINGVALAGDQAQSINILNNSFSIRTGDLLYHGFNASASVWW